MDKDETENIKDILGVVAEKIPALLTSLADVLYGTENAKKYGAAVAGFYKSLKDSGMTDEQAYELTKQYMSAMNLAGLVGQAMSRHGGEGGRGMNIQLGGHGHDDEDDE